MARIRNFRGIQYQRLKKKSVTVMTAEGAGGKDSAEVLGDGAADRQMITKSAVLNKTTSTTSYEIVVKNSGNVDLTGVVVTDKIEGGSLKVLPNSGSGFSGDGGKLGVLDVGETWTYTLSRKVGTDAFDVNGDDLVTNTATVDTDQTHTSQTLATVDITELQFSRLALMNHGAAWWNARPEAWDGDLRSNKHDNLVGLEELTRPDALNAVDSNKSNTITSTDAKGILIGDNNANGLTDLGETTLFVPLAVAQQIVGGSSSELRGIMMKEALVAQLNINNLAGDSTTSSTNAEGPNGLIGEAVQWLKGTGPYQKSTSLGIYTDGSTGRVDTNGDGILSVGNKDTFEYNTTTGQFTRDANGTAIAGNNLTALLQAWGQDVDVDGNLGSAIASGSDLSNVLRSFNEGGAHLVESQDGSQVGWFTGVELVGVMINNTPDAFWGVLQANGAI